MAFRRIDSAIISVDVLKYYTVASKHHISSIWLQVLVDRCIIRGDLSLLRQICTVGLRVPYHRVWSRCLRSLHTLMEGCLTSATNVPDVVGVLVGSSVKLGPHYQSCVALLLNTHSSNSKLSVKLTKYLSYVVYSNSLTCYGPYYIITSCILLVISNLRSVCLVKVSHTTDSVDPDLETQIIMPFHKCFVGAAYFSLM